MIGETLKAQNINIQDSPLRMQAHQLLLCLHGELLRYNDQKLLPGMQNGFFDHLLICITGLSASGIPEDKLQWHDLPLFCF